MVVDHKLESILASNGETTIPVAVRDALNLQAGDTLHYEVDGERIIVEVRRHPGAAALSGSLKSDKGKDMTFADIREAAAKDALNNGYFDKYR